jgi:hypothetical protein
MDKLLKATHEGKLTLGAVTLEVAVLDDGTRIISRNAIFKAFGRTKRGRALSETREPNMPSFIDAKNLQPFVDEEVRGGLKRLEYIDILGKATTGYNALILPLLCKVYHDARDAKALKISQMPLARVSEILLFSLSKIGIIALIDEVTGYQDVRVQDALQKILEKILLDEAKKYEVTFPLDLYKQWFRLNSWDWKPENAQKRPGVIGNWTKDLIYKRMAPGLLRELEIKNPKNARGHREHKHFQFLTDEVGEPKLREFFGGHIALAKASSNWRKYQEMVNRVYPRFGDTLSLDFPDME